MYIYIYIYIYGVEHFDGHVPLGSVYQQSPPVHQKEEEEQE